jgi:hypothetical protein
MKKKTMPVSPDDQLVRLWFASNISKACAALSAACENFSASSDLSAAAAFAIIAVTVLLSIGFYLRSKAGADG